MMVTWRATCGAAVVGDLPHGGQNCGRRFARRSTRTFRAAVFLGIPNIRYSEDRFDFVRKSPA